MLSDEQLNKILNKLVLEPEDIYLIHYHLDEIEKMQAEYGNRIPADVAMTTNIDIAKISERCRKYLENKENFKTTDLLVSKNVDLEKVYKEMDEFYHKKILDNKKNK